MHGRWAAWVVTGQLHCLSRIGAAGSPCPFVRLAGGGNAGLFFAVPEVQKLVQKTRPAEMTPEKMLSMISESGLIIDVIIKIIIISGGDYYLIIIIVKLQVKYVY